MAQVEFERVELLRFEMNFNSRIKYNNNKKKGSFISNNHLWLITNRPSLRNGLLPVENKERTCNPANTVIFRVCIIVPVNYCFQISIKELIHSSAVGIVCTVALVDETFHQDFSLREKKSGRWSKIKNVVQTVSLIWKLDWMLWMFCVLISPPHNQFEAF